MSWFFGRRRSVARPRGVERRAVSPVVAMPPPAASVGLPRPAFGNLGDPEIVSLYNAGTVRQVQRGQCLVREGDESASVFLMAEGAIELCRRIGEQATRIGVLSMGGCIEGLWAPPGTVHPFTATALEPSRVLEITPAALRQVSASVQAALCCRLMASLSARLGALATRHAEAVMQCAQLASFLARHDDRIRAALASPALQALIADIPRLPVYASDLAFKLLDEHANASDIVEAIKHNPPVAGLVLKTVNSPYYGLRMKVSDYYHAFLMLGVNHVYQLVLDCGIRSVMSNTDEDQEIQAHSYLISSICYKLAALSGAVPLQVVTTIGVLHEIGKSALLTLKARHADLAVFLDLLDPAKIGASLLATWGLPARVCEVIERQHEPEFSPPDRLTSTYAREVAILYLAHACHDLLVGQAAGVPTATAYAREYISLLGLSEQGPEDLYRNQVLPALLKQQACLPRRLRQLLNERAGVRQID